MDSPAPAGPRPSSHGFWIAVLIVLIGAAGAAGAFWWHQRARDPFRDALAVSPEEFLHIKGKGFVREVWLYGNGEVVAELRDGFVRKDRAYQRIWTGLPPGFLHNPEEVHRLYKGVDPGMFHYFPRR